MLPYLHDYMRSKYGNLREVEVSRDELEQLLIQGGKSQKDAQFLAKICQELGSEVLIGDYKVRIKPSEQEKKET